MLFQQILKIPQATHERIKHYLTVEPSCREECLSENSTISHTVTFGSGIEMDIKCCGVDFDETNQSNTAWTEAVLFCHGSEVCCSEPEDDYLGEWTLTYNGNDYSVLVTVEETQTTSIMTKEYVLQTLKEERLWKPGESDNFEAPFMPEWEFTLRREENKYQPFIYSLTGHKRNSKETWSRRYKSMDDAFLHILNHLNENANVMNKYDHIEDWLLESPRV